MSEFKATGTLGAPCSASAGPVRDPGLERAIIIEHRRGGCAKAVEAAVVAAVVLTSQNAAPGSWYQDIWNGL